MPPMVPKFEACTSVMSAKNLSVTYSTRKLKSPKWEIDHTETYFHQSKNPRMEGLLIMNCFDWHSRFFDLSSFGGFKNFRDEGTSRWAILPPSDLLSFIDFLFHHSQINLFQFNEILSMNLKLKNLWSLINHLVAELPTWECLHRKKKSIPPL